ncbi:Nuclear factor of activated T-cells, cytoplasmic 2 [Goodea atripinnis]|uniref:Nuclear factor of activated T-cells, cytoplasmic 2 n=1 Tax=Goodea atripinnis TaxID=208336 RepID=A0ABV0PWA7_9TELE
MLLPGLLTYSPFSSSQRIDCAGILKLRNADIELRKGETDVGRKNTRVRLVFRVHIPQPGGQQVSLQVASHPIECSQRSAHELPMVEKQDMESCSVLGGQQMILTGQNFSSDSKVIFLEKTHGKCHLACGFNREQALCRSL